MPDLHVFLFICCLISSGLFALSCTKSFLSVCKLRKGFSAIAYFLTTVLMQVLGTAVCIFVFDCRYLVPIIFARSLFGIPSLYRQSVADALLHSRCSRLFVHGFTHHYHQAVKHCHQQRSTVFTSETTPETALVPIAVLTASFLITCPSRTYRLKRLHG